MHVVTASDNNYVPGVFVLLASVARYNPGARFTILTTDWSAQNKAKLAAFTARTGLLIDTLEITPESLSTLPISRSHLTASVYARLFIADLMPDEDRVIYMDCDMLVTGSLIEAWKCDLQDCALAAVRCPMPTVAFARAINVPVEQYFNSGFLVLNLAYWRKNHFASACFQALGAPGCPYLSQDESALNDIGRGQVRYLPAGFNVYAVDIMWQSPLADPPSIRVIHFVTRPKPWNGPCTFGELWLAQMAEIPEFAGFISAPQTFRARLTRWNRIRRAFMGKLAGKAKYRNFRATGRFIHETLVQYYLTHGRFPKKGLDYC